MVRSNDVDPNTKMKLHHTTDEVGIDGIISSGVIKTTWRCKLDDDSMIELVWLTSRPDGWLRTVGPKTTTHRIEVSLPDHEVMSWAELKRNPLLPWAMARQFEVTANMHGIRSDPESWYVINRPIPLQEWIEIRQISDDRLIWPVL
jgi:hypothetical protein